MTKIFKERKIDFLIILVAILIASIPTIFAVDKTYFANGDMMYHMLRTDGFVEAIKNFSLPYRLNAVANGGYTSADPIMYPHLFLIIPAFFYAIFHNYIAALNLSAVCGHIFSAIIMYYSCEMIFKKRNASLTAALMMVLSCSRISLIYNGSAYAEYLATASLPLVASGYIGILRSDKKRWIDLLLGFSIIIETHIITLFYTSLLLIFISLFFIKKIIKKKETLWIFIKTIILTIMINLWYIVPFLDYYLSGKIIKPGGNVKTDWAVSSMMTIKDQFNIVFERFKQIFVFTPITTTHRQLTYMTIAAIVFLVVYFIYSIVTNGKNKLINVKTISITNDEKINIFICKVFIIIFFYNILVSLGVFSQCFFAYFLFLQKFYDLQQMETRELMRGLPLFFMAFSYIYDSTLKSKALKIIPIFVIAVIPLSMFYKFTFSNLGELRNYKNFSNGDYMLKSTLHGNASQILINDYDCIFPEDIFDGNIKISDENANITNISKGYLSYRFDYEKSKDNELTIEIPYFAYSGFKVYEKGKELKIKKGENGVIAINPKNNHGKISVVFKEKLIWLICDILSVLSLVFIVGKAIYSRRFAC